MSTVRRFGDVEVVEVAAKSILNAVRGMPFGWSINPYQGCFHQCVFCYARRTHGFRDLDGERSWGGRLFVKVNAPQVLRRELAHPRWRGDHVAIGTATDPYQPLEGSYRLTRGIVAALARARTPGHITTRGPLIVRDLDVLQSWATVADVGVAVSIATLDEALAREIEPTVAPPRQRLRAVARLAAAGIRVSVAVAPVMPGINDAPGSLEAVIAAAADAGAHRVWHSSLRLGDVTREAFLRWLADARPALGPLYAASYPRAEAPVAYRDTLDRRVGAAAAAAAWRRLPLIDAAPEPQLTLFGAGRGTAPSGA